LSTKAPLESFRYCQHGGLWRKEKRSDDAHNVTTPQNTLGLTFHRLATFCPSRYFASMDMRGVALFISIFLLVAALDTLSAEENFSGEYADKNLLNGQGEFKMSLQQSGGIVSVWFSAGYNDGHGCGPEATGTGKINAKGTIEFTFRDSYKNAGTGRIAPAGDGIIVSFKTKKLSDSSCLEFYRQKMRLKRVGKSGSESQTPSPTPSLGLL
jgi:hypothetical protein